MDFDIAEHCLNLTKAIGKINSAKEVWNRGHINEWLTEGLSDISNLKSDSSKLSQHREFLTSLQSLRDVLCDAVDSIDPIVKEVERDIRFVGLENGIYTLPDEVLSKIFERNNMDTFHAGNKRYHPGCLSAVSKKFRTVALDTPRLWSTIFAKNSLESNKLFLERSKAVDLTIIFESSTQIEQFVDITLQECHRWSTVCFATQELLDFSKLNPKLEASFFPNLKAISYNPVRTYDSFPFKSWNLPGLRSFEGGGTFPSAPWARMLTHCSLSFFGSFSINDLLNAFEQLEACRFFDLRLLPNKYFIDSEDSFDFSTVQTLMPPSRNCFPKLEFLSIRLTEKDHIQVLKVLTAHHIPLKQLRDFYIVLHPRLQSYWQIQRFKFPELKKMILMYSDYSLYDGCRYERRNIPKLEHLEITNFNSFCYQYISYIYDYVKIDGAAAPLKTITFRNCDRLDENAMQTIMEALVMPEYSQFQKLYIYNCKMSKHYLRRIESLLPGKIEWV